MKNRICVIFTGGTIGSCSRGETVEEACMVHGIEVEKLLALVNEEANKKAE